MGTLQDKLFEVLEWLFRPLRARRDAQLRRWMAEMVRDDPRTRPVPPTPPWDVADPQAPDWTLCLKWIGLPRPGTPECVRIDLWSSGKGRVGRGRRPDDTVMSCALDADDVHSVIESVLRIDAEALQLEAQKPMVMRILDGAPASLEVFRRAPFSALSHRTNLGLIDYPDNQPATRPLLETCARLLVMARRV